MNLLKALLTVSGLTFVSRILGLARDILIARVFGAGLATDAFFVAFRIPNLLRRLFAEGAFAQGFVPILAEYKSREGAEQTKQLVDRAATLLTLVLLVVSVLGVLIAPAVILIGAPGFAAEPGKFALTVELLRITFPYILFISLVALAGGVLNTWSRFAIPAITPSLLNLAFIVAAAFLAPYFDPPIKALAWAVFVGGLLQLALQAPALARIGMLPRPRAPWRDPGVRRILRLMVPAVFAVSAAQISLLLNTIIASYLVTGSVSWLYYADRLMEFPSGMLGAALGTILLPSLAKHYADDDPGEFSRLLDWGLRITLMLALPAAVALALLATPLVATLFKGAAFTAHDVLMTRNATIAYSLGLVGLILVKVLAPGFYARQNVTTPVKIAVITLLATQLLNLVLVVPFGHAGLAAAIGLAACLNAGMLWRKLRTHAIYVPRPGWLAFMAKLTIAIVLMAAFLLLVNRTEAWWIDARSADRVAMLAPLVIGGAAVYFATLFALGFRPRDFVRYGAGADRR